ncbi:MULTISPECIES: ABC transporter ATP-binding protein [Paenibacillus]|uniref:ATP-binding cassette domain-containing protein n=1 Tax=Paenibacillus phytohabitans TaxID=2654978 RepID=A0ABX1YQK6_9BACL|nr:MULTISPECIES: ABC transporter ATP-binding protein [unclassified Paenibacillus]AIQ29664.1 multidrug ABC transporter ATP-binding protein [Paenibacillus sp. FSL P4-0081]NOU81904.1 ATP-binding cassette domain-containing protein [Paenibacillus phytohabitans]OMF26879.1 multidrug ABC transporter ATP-binding protein [Paenibacillus sp. FSL H8-0259]
MDELLEVQGVTKKFGSKQALGNVSFTLGAGRITGLLGSNGSGKSTLMKLIAGLAQPGSGRISVLGVPIGVESRKLVSFMPDVPVTESWMNVGDALKFQRDFYPDFDQAKAQRMLDFMNLRVQDKVRTLSKGMNERLQLTLALSRRARLYMLDEPIGGVDPVARTKILNALMEFYEEDSSILISTHLVNDIERIFDEVIFLKNGEIVLQREVEELRLERGKSIDELFREVFAEC